MSRRSRSLIYRYGTAIAATCLALAFPHALQAAVGSLSPAVIFILAVFVSAGYGGLGPGLFTTAAGILYGIHVVSQNDNPDYPAVVVFGIVGLLLSTANEALYRTRVLADQEIQARQAELEALNEQLQRAMMETHHRVKNNLQSVAAIVDMQLMDGEDAIPAEKVAGIRDYVLSLSAVHQVLTNQARKDATAERVSSRAALAGLIPLLQKGAPRTCIKLHADDALLTTQQITGVCIIVNELVQNASRVARCVQVRLRVQEGTALLEVQDDGPGFDPLPDPAHPTSTGLELVASVAQWDLGGTLRYANLESGGAKVTVCFKV